MYFIVNNPSTQCIVRKVENVKLGKFAEYLIRR